MKKKFFRSIAHYLPQTLLLISLLTSNVLFPAIVIAQEVENINVANTVTQEETVPDILEEGISTSIYEQENIPEIQTPPFTFENGIYTVNNVIPEEEYIYPENDNVRVKFTEVTQEGNLIIKRVELTQEQKELLNTKDNYGWDITSSMENGTFKYTLTLPNIYDSTNVEVKYTEDGNNYESIEEVSNINNNNIVIEGLDHFTMFIVINPLPDGVSNGGTCTVASIEGKCYNTIQAAINAAVSGDTINVAPGVYDETLLIGESKNNITIGAIRDTNSVVIKPKTAVPSTNRIVDIRGSNIKFTYFLIDGSGNSYVGISISGQGNVIESNIIENVLTGIQTTTAKTEGNNTIASNTVKSATVALSLQNDENWIEKNAFSNISSEGMGVLNAKNSTIIENEFYINTTGVNLRDYSSTPSSYVNLSDIININKNVFSNLVYITDISGNILGNTLYTKISDAINAASDGNIINVGNGTYTEDLDITKSITLKSINGYEKTTIKGFIQISSNNVTVDGFTIDNNNQTDGRAIAPGSSSGTTITNNKIVNAYRGIQGDYYGRPKNLTITNNIFESISYGIASTEDITNLLVTGNTFKTSQEGIGLGVGVTFPTGKTIDNLLTDNAFNITGGYAIGDYRSGTLVVYQALLAQITSVTTDKGYYKKGDTLTIKVTVKNTGTIPFDSSTEKLAVNLMSPSNKYVSGTFAEYRPLSLGAGKSTELTFYTTQQTILSTWAEGTYTVHTSIYSSRVPKGYLDGGQYRGTPFVVDNTAPSKPSITNTPNNSYSNINSITINWSDGDDQGTIQSGIKGYILRYVFTPADGSDIEYWNTGLRESGNPKTHSGIYGDGEGKYEIFVKTVDNAGNESPESDSFTITYDITAPIVKLVSPIDNYYTNSTVVRQEWNTTATDVAYYDYRSCSNNPSDGTCNGIYTETKTVKYRNVYNNNITFWWQVRAVDLAGNIGKWSTPRKITIDTIAPVVHITSPSEGTYLKGTVELQGEIVDNNLWRYFYRVRNISTGINVKSDTVYTNSLNGTFYTWNTTSSADGKYIVHLAARDLADNQGTESIDEFQVTVDNTPPEGEIRGIRYDSQDIEGYFITNDNTPKLFGTCIDTNIDTVKLTIDKDTSNIQTIDLLCDSGKWVADITNRLLDGEYTATLTITDKAGNSFTTEQKLTIDTKAPFATHTYYKNGTKITDSKTYISSINELTYTGIFEDKDSSGLYKDVLVVFRKSDNKAYCSWSQSLSPTGGVLLNGDLYEELTTQQNVSKCVNSLPEGEYYIRHRVYDNAIRRDAPAYHQHRQYTTLEFVIDSTAPTVEITSPSEKSILRGTVEIKGFVTDNNLSHYNISIYKDGADTQDSSLRIEQRTEYTSEFSEKTLYTWNTTNGNFPDGVYQIRLAARDKAGNRDLNGTSEQIIKVTVDNTAPTISDHLNITLTEGETFQTSTVLLTDNYGVSQVCGIGKDITNNLTTSEICIDADLSNLIGDQFKLMHVIKGQIETWKGKPITTVDLNIIPAGQYEVNYYAYDKAGNKGNEETFTITVVDNVPTVTITATDTEITRGDADIVLSTSVTGGNQPLTYVWSGACTGTSSSTTFAGSTAPGAYTCTVTVTDADGDTVTKSIDITVLAQPTPATTGGEVLGATTGPTTTTKPSVKGTTTTKTTPNISEDTQTEELLETTSIEEPSVLGERCENKKKVSGYVYIDENKDKEMNDNEKGIKDITITIQYTDEEGNIKTEEEVSTDEKGYWETQLCSGKYNIVVKEDTLPKNIEVPEVLSLTVSDNEKETIFNIQALDTRNFWQKYWYLIVGGLAIIVIGYTSIKNRKKEEI